VKVVKTHAEVGSDGTLRLDLRTELPAGPVDVIVTLEPIPRSPNGAKYDFADLSGKLKWQGDAVAVQRKLRDEW